jgi:hypothetical protein
MSTVEGAKQRIGSLEEILKNERQAIDVKVKEAIESERKKGTTLQKQLDARDVTAV